MQVRRLGSSGPELSVIGFGAWEAGGDEWGAAPEEQVLAAMRAVFDCGIDWLDTAEVYGAGRSEELVGLAISGRRDDVAVATKVAPRPEGSGFRPEDVRRACTGSLGRLRTGHLDLYQLHWPDDSGIPLEETWGAMAGLVDEGLVRAVGVSNFDLGMIERCEAVRHVDSLQQEFSMLRTRDRELLRWCGEHGIGVLAYGPLAYGLLAGSIGAETRFAHGDWRGEEDEDDESWVALFEPSARARHLSTVDALRPVAERLGVTLAQLALAWTVDQPGVTAAIAGSRDAAHVRSNADAGDLRLDETTRLELDAILSRGSTD